MLGFGEGWKSVNGVSHRRHEACMPIDGLDRQTEPGAREEFCPSCWLPLPVFCVTPDRLEGPMKSHCPLRAQPRDTMASVVIGKNLLLLGCRCFGICKHMDGLHPPLPIQVVSAF